MNENFFDWTIDCIAVTNKEIEELYNNVQIGIEIEIIGVMDKLVGFFSEFSSCGQNGWCFFQQNDYP